MRVRSWHGARAARAMPLYGIPFAVKDNIDVAGSADHGRVSGVRVSRRAQRARGRALDRRRRDHGRQDQPRSVRDRSGRRALAVRHSAKTHSMRATSAGGSSSGSAVAVARGLQLRARHRHGGLGPRAGGVQQHGRPQADARHAQRARRGAGVPVARLRVGVRAHRRRRRDAWRSVMAGFDAEDPYARAKPNLGSASGAAPPRFRFVVPAATQRVFDDARVVAAVRSSAARVRARGRQRARGRLRAVPQGRRVALRRAVGGRALEARARCSRAIRMRSIRRCARSSRAPRRTRRATRSPACASCPRCATRSMRCGTTPTSCSCRPCPGTTVSIRCCADPLALNARLGVYANFVNLLDLCALAIPAGFRSRRLAVRRHVDRARAGATRCSRASGACCTRRSCPRSARSARRSRSCAHSRCAAASAHSSPWSARTCPASRSTASSPISARACCARTRSAPRYRLFALPTTPPKPGLVRVGEGEAGAAIELEVWELDNAQLGRFMRGVRAPLCIGTLELEDGSSVLGFLVRVRGHRRPARHLELRRLARVHPIAVRKLRES